MSDKFVGQIFMVGFNFAPSGSLLCDGQMLNINQYPSLYAVIGTTYGGDGRPNFALPDLRGRTPAGAGTFSGAYPLGRALGAEKVTLTVAENGPHTHGVSATAGTGVTDVSPGGYAFAATPATSTPLYGPAQNLVSLGTTAPAGGGQPHDNMQPYLTISFCIVADGILPSR